MIAISTCGTIKVKQHLHNTKFEVPGSDIVLQNYGKVEGGLRVGLRSHGVRALLCMNKFWCCLHSTVLLLVKNVKCALLGTIFLCNMMFELFLNTNTQIRKPIPMTFKRWSVGGIGFGGVKSCRTDCRSANTAIHEYIKILTISTLTIHHYNSYKLKSN